MTSTPTRDLEHRLQALADTLDDPQVPVTDDLARGRRHLRRRRRAVGAGVAATAALVLAAPMLVDAWSDDPAHQSPADNAPSGPSLGFEDEVDLPLGPSDHSRDSVPAWTEVDPDAALVVRRAVARHLDPDGTHIKAASITDISEVSVGSADGRVLTEQHHLFKWAVPGDDRASVEVVVSSVSLNPCSGSDIECTDVVLGGLDVVRIDQDPYNETDVAWVHERADGYSVKVALYGAVEVEDGQVAAVLADPALDLPGHPSPPELDRLPSTLLRDVARDVFGDRLAGDEFWTDDMSPYWSGQLEAPLAGRVDLTQMLQDYDFGQPCDEANRQRCTVGTIDGHRIRVDQYRTVDDADGRFKVVYDGPTRLIEVESSPDDRLEARLSLEDGIALATDPRLQS